MDDYLTTRQVLDILKVDRITIYRMLQDGRIKGVKVGQQWRFARREIERIVGGEVLDEISEPSASQDPTFPVHCVQTIQDLFSDVSQIGANVVDVHGEPVTEISNPCSVCQMILSDPSGAEACRASWQAIASNGNNGQIVSCHAGLLYAQAPILDKGEKTGTYLIGPFLLKGYEVGEEAAQARQLSAKYNLPKEALQQALSTVPVVGADRQPFLKTWPAAAVKAVQSILEERRGFIERLQQIANLTQFSKGAI
jgi:excisionase family DNA binding protein